MPKAFHIKIYLLVSLFWLSPNILEAQTGQQLFKGRINDLNDIHLSLTFNGDQIEGTMKLLRSATILNLKGKQEGDRWLLEESKNDLLSAWIEGRFVNGVFSGEWTNVDRSLSARIYFERTAKHAAFASRCGDNKWARIYEGSVGNKKAALILQKNCMEDLKGSLEIDGQTVYDLKGDFEAVGKNWKINSTLRGINSEKLGFFDGELEGNRKLSGWMTKDGERVRFAFEFKEEIAVGCKVFMDYMTAFDLLYPKSRESKLNSAILAKASEWQTEAYRYMDSLRRMQFDLVPEWRHQARAYGGYHLAKADQKIVSGYMQVSNTWGGKEAVWAFNYDVSNNRVFDWEDQFKRKFNHQRFFKNKIKAGIKELPLKDNADFETWIDEQSFDQYFFRTDGIVFISDFHPLFGIQKILIPYEAFQGKLKRKSILKTMIN